MSDPSNPRTESRGPTDDPAGNKPTKVITPDLLDARYGVPITRDPKYTEATLHVHGYAAARHDKEHHKLLDQIAADGPETHPVVVRWESGDWKITLALPLVRFLPALYKSKRIASALNPSLLLLDAAIVTGGAAYHYYRVSDRAIDVGRSLRQAIESIPYDRVNLVGHSLGTSAVAECLKHWTETPSSKEIGHVVFLGGATSCNGYEWDKLVEPIEGCLANLYNPSDLALLAIGFLKRIGRHPIPVEHDRLVNIEVKEIGHVEYWKNLPRVRKLLRDRLAIHL